MKNINDSLSIEESTSGYIIRGLTGPENTGLKAHPVNTDAEAKLIAAAQRLKVLGVADAEIVAALNCITGATSARVTSVCTLLGIQQPAS